MSGTGRAFRSLAASLETIETDATVGTNADITTVTSPGGNLLDDRIDVEFEVRVPVIDPAAVSDGVEVEPQEVAFDSDGTLVASFLATITRSLDAAENETESVAAVGDERPNGETGVAFDDEGGSAPDGGRDVDSDSHRRQQPAGESDPTEAADGSSPVDDGTSDDEGEPERNSSAERERKTDAGNEQSDAAADVASADGEPGSRPGDSPAYRDPDRLREVYDACETFAEMTEALDVDVTPQTVRRYMIKHRIHEPTTRSRTASVLQNCSPDSISTATEAASDEASTFDEEQPSAEASASKELPDHDAEMAGDETNEGERTVPSDGGIRNEGTPTGRRPSARQSGSSDVERAEGDARSNATASSDDAKDPESTADGTETPASEARSGDDAAEPAEERTSDGDDLSELDERTLVERVELPDHLSLDDVKDVVSRSKTLYDAQRQLELDRDQTRQLLQELNLLNLVHGRLSKRHLERRTIDEINRRIRSTVAP